MRGTVRVSENLRGPTQRNNNIIIFGVIGKRTSARLSACARLIFHRCITVETSQNDFLTVAQNINNVSVNTTVIFQPEFHDSVDKFKGEKIEFYIVF